ncbi:MAG: tetratricopeptide repeat protein [Pseudomonadales bacterium]|jgi:tetratricopeptide (TPR) repeat protein|nr:tetratricopeptide repeat protein [Pseudomonadales bacterium]MDP7594964.1 tetratricopeptide repeat protein [Pseudomonadales bacterium]HJN51246.1 tetratricopeptide repeat protein [Pseudomonadales bacterium]|tara:strand:+ start:3199 stop:4644 length:1446 start_codon:yes stop_codon:yes gene_type:complete
MLKLAGIILLSLPLAVTLSCSMGTETQEQRLNEVSIRGADTVVAAPLAVSFEESVPKEVSELLRDLLGKASAEPDSGVRRGELGMAYEVNGYPDAAFTSYQQAEQLEQSEARWPYYRALILADRGELEEALQVLDRVIGIDATYAPAWMWRGTWSLAIGLANRAGEAFTRAESLGIGWEARANQARVRLRLDRPEEAVAILEPLSRASPTPGVFLLLGQAYRDTGRLADARIALARGKSAQRIEWSDDWQEKKQAYEVAFGARFLHAQRLMRRDRTHEALNILEPLIQEQPANELLITTLSVAYAMVGQTQSGFMVLLRALQKYPEYDTVHLSVAGFYESEGNQDRALEHLNRAIELNPVAPEPYIRKGLLLQQQRKHEGALAAFESALHHNERDPRLLFHVGDVQAALKRWPEAIERFEQSVRIDPSFTPGHLNLALTLGQANRFAEARVALKTVEELGTHESDVQAVLRQLTRLEEEAR